MRGSRLRVWLHGATEANVDFTDPTPMTAEGSVGIRAWGAPVHVNDLTVTAAGAKEAAGPGATAELRSLQSFCLLLFNLNEFLYVD